MQKKNPTSKKSVLRQIKTKATEIAILLKKTLRENVYLGMQYIWEGNQASSDQVNETEDEIDVVMS